MKNEKTIKHRIKWDIGLNFQMPKITTYVLLTISVIIPLYIYFRDNSNLIPALIWFACSLLFTYGIWRLIQNGLKTKKVVGMTIQPNLTTLEFVTNNTKIQKVELINDDLTLVFKEVFAPRHTYRSIIFRTIKKDEYVCSQASGLWDEDRRLEIIFNEIKQSYSKVKRVKNSE